MTLRLYDDEFSGHMLYAEAQKVPADKRTSLSLGRGQTLKGRPDTGLTPDKLWLEVTIGDAVMNPRLNLAELETRSNLHSDTGWTMADAGLRGVGNSTLTIDNDGITLDEVKTPLTLSGSVSENGVIQATNSNVIGYGISGEASGIAGYGVFGNASATGNVINHGGVFQAMGNSGIGALGHATASGDFTNYGGVFQANGDKGRGVYGETTGISGLGVYGKATGSNGNAVYGYASGSAGNGIFGATTGSSGHGVHGYATATGDVTNYGGYFIANGDTGRGVYGSGKAYSFYAGGSGTDFGPFTGAHDVRLEVDVADEIRPGMIVVCTGLVEVREDDDGRPCLSSTLPTVTLAAKANDKKVFGVLVKECSLPEDYWYEAADDEHFGIVNALGEGLVWVCDINGKIEAGDCITSSTVPGYGQLQDDDFIHSYTLGKATADVDWDSVTNTVEYNGRKVKVYLIPVVYTSG